VRGKDRRISASVLKISIQPVSKMVDDLK